MMKSGRVFHLSRKGASLTLAILVMRYPRSSVYPQRRSGHPRASTMAVKLSGLPSSSCRLAQSISSGSPPKQGSTARKAYLVVNGRPRFGQQKREAPRGLPPASVGHMSWPWQGA
jgi:hypothetical protein